MAAQFKVLRADKAAVAGLMEACDLPHFIAHTLAARGITDPRQAEDFLHPSLERDWLNPYDIPGLSEVADMLEQAILEHRRVLVFGDFDLDGISATTVLTRGLRALGCHATPFIPRRFEEGYGVTLAAYERARQHDPDLIVTVDCGIANKHEVAAIVADGTPVAVTDHHEASDLVPEGVPVADPKLVDGCESAILAGVGVALKLVQVLGGRRGFPHLWRSYTDLATLGTVADLMPMRGENRALVADGLQRMNSEPRPCIAALVGACGAADKPLTSTSLSFSLIPRLNAAGRMGDAQLALDLLMCDDFDEACALASQLEGVNDQRRAREAELSAIATAEAERTYRGERVVVVAGEGWHEGVKGIVASRLVNAYGVPSLLFTIEGEEARGSGRSVGKVNLFRAVEFCGDLLTRFGGHEAAVGVTLPTANLDAFRERLAAYLDHLPEEDFRPRQPIDATVQLGELTLDAVSRLEALAPFGQENPEPVLLARNVVLQGCRAVGADKTHFSCLLSNGCASVNAIMFHCGTIEALLANDSVVDAAFAVQVDEWRGRRSVKAMLRSVEPARACSALTACLDPAACRFCSDLFGEEGAPGPEGPVGAASQAAQGPGAAGAGNAGAPGAGSEAACSAASPAAPGPGTGPAVVAGGPDGERSANRAFWQSVARDDPERLEAAVIAAIIGPDAQPHASQRAVLDRLRAGESVLAVMATGRGKSLIFQTFAACQALGAGKASLFVYPLRALIADQAFHLTRAFERFGLSCAVLTGESSAEERAAIYEGLGQGSVDIVLTTPEYLSFHAEKVAACGRIGFMVVDEAHHIGLAKAGQRLAYTELGAVAARLGDPVVLALTATAPDEVARDIRSTLPLDGSVVDETARDNLHVCDRRNLKNREDYLAHLIAGGAKTVIYVNSREQSVALARHLRLRVPQLALMVGFYNADLSREERTRVEAMFRKGDLLVLVATSAFGEGIDIPDIRHVALYHLPFNDVEFNQMSGRAGRDGRDAWVHLLYGQADVALNEGILADLTPSHDVMAQVYRRLRALQREAADQFFRVSREELAATASQALSAVSPSAATCGVAVFRELGLIETRVSYEGGKETLLVRVNEGAAKVELTDSVRYREGLEERDGFAAFREWALGSSLPSLTTRVCHPIVPRG